MRLVVNALTGKSRIQEQLSDFRLKGIRCMLDALVWLNFYIISDYAVKTSVAIYPHIKVITLMTCDGQAAVLGFNHR